MGGIFEDHLCVADHTRWVRDSFPLLTWRQAPRNLPPTFKWPAGSRTGGGASLSSRKTPRERTGLALHRLGVDGACDWALTLWPASSSVTLHIVSNLTKLPGGILERSDLGSLDSRIIEWQIMKFLTGHRLG
jgi:hypothetical protein